VSSTVVDVTLSRSRYGDSASSPCVREIHFDVEATFGSGTWDERGAVGADDGADDGQAKSVSAGVSDSLAAELLEGLEKTLDLVGWDHWSGVLYRNACASCGRCRCYLDPASGRVVA